MGKPKPFQRPSISLDTGVKKDWQEVEVQVLVRGDNVRGYGVIDQVTRYDDMITIKWTNGTTSIFVASDLVIAFTAV